MSYCRWSTDDFQCDLYIYEDVYGGWTTHVAGARVVYLNPLPDPVPLLADTVDAWAERNQEIMRRLDDPTEHRREDIDLPFAGETFSDSTPGECADRVEQLLAAGYRCPSGVVEALRAEQAEMDLVDG